MAIGLRGYRTDYGQVTVTLNGSGAGTQAATFSEAFVNVPSLLVVPHAGDSGTFAATSATKTGFTVSVTGSDQLSQDIQVIWFAHEKS